MTLKEALALLGAMTVEEIRILFQRQHITGNHSSRNCPVARWLNKETSSTVQVTSLAIAEGTKFFYATPPVSVQRFIMDFDEDRFPELLGPW